MAKDVFGHDEDREQGDRKRRKRHYTRTPSPETRAQAERALAEMEIAAGKRKLLNRNDHANLNPNRVAQPKGTRTPNRAASPALKNADARFAGMQSPSGGFGGFGSSQVSQSFPPANGASQQSGGFNFSAGAPSNPFANVVGQNDTPNTQPSGGPSFQGSIFNFGGAPSTPALTSGSNLTTPSSLFGSKGLDSAPSTSTSLQFGQNTPQQNTSVTLNGQQDEDMQTSPEQNGAMQQAQPDASKASSFSFGQSMSQPPTSLFNFGATAAQQPAQQASTASSPFNFSFGGQAQQQSAATTTPSSSFHFGASAPSQQSAAPSSPFNLGATAPAQQSAATTQSLFSTSAPQQPPATASTTSLFNIGQTQPQSPAPSSAPLFSAPQQTNDTAKTANPFANILQHSTQASNMFAAPASPEKQATSPSKPVSNPFAFLNQSAPAPQAQEGDATANTRSLEEQKKDKTSLFSRMEFPAKPNTSQAPENQANGAISKPPATNIFQPTNNMNGTPQEQAKPASNGFNLTGGFGASSAQTPSTSSGGLFSPTKTAGPTQSSNNFNFPGAVKPSDQAPPPAQNLNGLAPSTSTTQPPSTSSLSSPQKPAGQTSQFSAAAKTSAAATESTTTTTSSGPASVPANATSGQQQAQEMRELNIALLRFLNGCDISDDWGEIISFYLNRREQILGGTSCNAADKATQATGATAHSMSQPQSSLLNGGPVQTQSAFSAPPAAAPPSNPSKKRKELPSNEEQDGAAEKRSKPTDQVTYPNLGASTSSPSPSKPLSDTANIFNNILNSPAQKATAQATPAAAHGSTPQAPAFSPLTPAVDKDSGAAAAPVAKPTFDTASSTPTASPFKLGATHSGNTASPFKLGTTSSTSIAGTFKLGDSAAGSSSAGPTVSAAPAFSLPKFGTVGKTDFTKVFGAKAEEQAEKDKAKRKAEDFDSDEDDPEEWERQYQEQQRAKKQKLEEESKGRRFVLDKAAPAANAFAQFAKKAEAAKTAAQDESDESDEDDDLQAAIHKRKSTSPEAIRATGASPEKGLADRMTSGADGKPERETPAEKENTPSTPFKFGTGSATSAFGGFKSTTSPASDNTWKNNTPIKFGNATSTASPSKETDSTTPVGSPAKPTADASQLAAGTPMFSFPSSSSTGSAFGSASKGAFSGLFGNSAGSGTSSAPSTSLFAAQPAKPTVGFAFGGTSATTSLAPSQDVSRATTPGLVTDAEGSAAESAADDETQSEAQQDDLTALTAEERKNEEELFKVKGRARCFNKEAEVKWEVKGLGPVRLMKHKETGKARVYMRQDPSGKVVLNRALMKSKGLYYLGAGDKAVVCAFAEGADQIGQWMIQFGKKEDAQDLLAKIHKEIDEMQ